jgi:hypothetical protein
MSTPNIRKRKRQTITLEETQSILEASKIKLKVSDLTTHFGNKYPYISKPWNNIVKNIPKKENYGKFPANLLYRLTPFSKAKTRFKKQLTKFEDFLYQEQAKRAVQTSITQFFI